jgi:hypothetical protein
MIGIHTKTGTTESIVDDVLHFQIHYSHDMLTYITSEFVELLNNLLSIFRIRPIWLIIPLSNSQQTLIPCGTLHGCIVGKKNVPQLQDHKGIRNVVLFSGGRILRARGADRHRHEPLVAGDADAAATITWLVFSLDERGSEFISDLIPDVAISRW